MPRARPSLTPPLPLRSALFKYRLAATVKPVPVLAVSRIVQAAATARLDVSVAVNPQVAANAAPLSSASVLVSVPLLPGEAPGGAAPATSPPAASWNAERRILEWTFDKLDGKTMLSARFALAVPPPTPLPTSAAIVVRAARTGALFSAGHLTLDAPGGGGGPVSVVNKIMLKFE